MERFIRLHPLISSGANAPVVSLLTKFNMALSRRGSGEKEPFLSFDHQADHLFICNSGTEMKKGTADFGNSVGWDGCIFTPGFGKMMDLIDWKLILGQAVFLQSGVKKTVTFKRVYQFLSTAYRYLRMAQIPLFCHFLTKVRRY